MFYIFLFILSFNKQMRSKRCFLIRFGGNWPKKDSVEGAKYAIQKLLLFQVSGFLKWIRTREKKSHPDQHRRTRIRNAAMKKALHLPHFGTNE